MDLKMAGGEVCRPKDRRGRSLGTSEWQELEFINLKMAGDEVCRPKDATERSLRTSGWQKLDGSA